MKKNLRNFAILLLVSYVSFSFILMNINPMAWSSLERFLLIITPIVYLGMVL